LFVLLPPPPSATLFPYTTLFRSTRITDTEPDQCMHLPGMVQSAFFQIMRRCDMSVYGLAAQVMQQALEQGQQAGYGEQELARALDRKSTRLNSSHVKISYAVFCL